MKKVVLKTYAKVLTAFFTLLGTITGCDYFEPRCEYEHLPQTSCLKEKWSTNHLKNR